MPATCNRCSLVARAFFSKLHVTVRIFAVFIVITIDIAGTQTKWNENKDQFWIPKLMMPEGAFILGFLSIEG